jgi:hypothetical protein
MNIFRQLSKRAGTGVAFPSSKTYATGILLNQIIIVSKTEYQLIIISIIVPVVSKINDLKSHSTPDDFERCKLASAYRLIDHKRWDWNIYNHVTVKNLDSTKILLYTNKINSCLKTSSAAKATRNTF